MVAWRGGRRFVERLNRAAEPERATDAVVRADGSYIVTGGLGGIGLKVAAWLVESGAGRWSSTGAVRRRRPPRSC